MSGRVQEQRQQGFEEEAIDSQDLLDKLEQRQELRDQIDDLKYGGDGRLGYNELHKTVKGLLNGMELDPTRVYRCGRFVIKPDTVEEKEVTFTQRASVRWDIQPDAS